METIVANSENSKCQIIMKDKTYSEYIEDIRLLAEKVQASGKTYVALMPVPRGGYFPAIQLGRMLDLPITYQYEEGVLVVDDILDSGATLKQFPDNDTAVVYAKRSSANMATYVGQVEQGWLVLPDEKGCGIDDHIRRMLEYIGEDPNRDGLRGTPERITRMWKEIFRGYDESQKPKITTFPNEEGMMDIVFDKGEYYSMCEHHILPFFGKYYFAYIPKSDGRILGISKVARVVGYCAAKLQLQERLAVEIVEMLSEALNGEALGFAIVMKGTHMCKTMRGVRNNGTMTVAHFTGVFNEEEYKQEFYKLIDVSNEV